MGNPAGEIFLAGLAVGQKAEGSPGLLGTGVGGGFDARGQSLGERAEVFDEDATGVEISFHDGGRSLWVHHPNFYPNARGSATLVAAWPR